jgi:hypothetical protein
LELSFLSGATTLHYQAWNLVSTLFARTLLTLELCLAIRLPPVRTSAHSTRLNQKDSLVASLDLAAFASIPSGKKNSRGAWHLRQIDGVYGVLQQVRRGVTGRRPASAAERGGRDGIRARLIAAEFFLAQDVTGTFRAPRLRSERCIAAHECVIWTPLRPRRPCACPRAGSGNDHAANPHGRAPRLPTSPCGCSGTHRPPQSPSWPLTCSVRA